MSAKSIASRSSFLTRRWPQLSPWGLARCPRAPLACNRSTTQYQPYVASITTSGSGPASATTAATANGSFATRTHESFSPVALIRTTTERRR